MFKSSGKGLKFISAIMALIFIAFWATIAVCLVRLYIEKKYVYPLKYSKEIFEYAQEYSIERALVYSLIKAESNFNERAQSHKGAKGLMQITERTAEYVASKVGKKDYNLFDVKDNVSFGCWYLRYLMNKFDSINTALCAYNAGEGKVGEWLKNSEYSLDGISLQTIPFKETKEYIEKIERYYKKYKSLYKKELEG